MERILQHTIEGISLDTKGLATMAERLEADSQSGAVAQPSIEDHGALEIEDEACTMQPVGHIITRPSNRCPLVPE